MALYEYLCRECQAPFEVRRSMEAVEGQVICPRGHTDVRRKLSVFASVGARTTEAAVAGPASGGGGCCGGACGCGH